MLKQQKSSMTCWLAAAGKTKGNPDGHNRDTICHSFQPAGWATGLMRHGLLMGSNSRFCLIFFLCYCAAWSDYFLLLYDMDFLGLLNRYVQQFKLKRQKGPLENAYVQHLSAFLNITPANPKKREGLHYTSSHSKGSPCLPSQRDAYLYCWTHKITIQEHTERTHVDGWTLFIRYIFSI